MTQNESVVVVLPPRSGGSAVALFALSDHLFVRDGALGELDYGAHAGNGHANGAPLRDGSRCDIEVRGHVREAATLCIKPIGEVHGRTL